MVPFYGWGSTASRLEPFRGGSLLFSTIDLTRKIEFPFRGSPLKNNIKLSAPPSKKKKKIQLAVPQKIGKPLYTRE